MHSFYSLVPLDKPEEFMYQLTKMQHFKERLECWLFQDKFLEIICGIGKIIFVIYGLIVQNPPNLLCLYDTNKIPKSW